MKRSPLTLLTLLACVASPALAQQRQPANVSTLPQSSPQEFDLLDNTGKWMPLGTASGGAFTAFGGAGVDIRAFGAKCDGATDDKPAIDAAVNAVQTAGGGVVFIPPSMGGCRDTGTLAITQSNVSVQGQQFGGSQILFDNGSANSINVGTGRGNPAVYYIALRDLYINHLASKAAGTALSFQSVSQAALTNIVVNNAWNGALFDQTNSIKLDYVSINSVPDSGGNGINFVTAGNDPTIRSDVLALSNVLVNMHATKPGTSEGLHIDGFSNDVRIKGLGILNAGSYGFHTVNTSGNASYNPQFAEAYDLEIDGEWSEAIKLDAGNNWMFVHATVNSIHDVNPADAIVEINPDTSGSVTRQVYFTGSYIGTGPGSCMKINGVRDSLITGSTIANCGKYAGQNGLGGAKSPVPVLEVGAQARGLTVVGNAIGYVYGQCCAGSNNYAVQVDAGASGVLLGSNNYHLFNPSTSSSSAVLPLTPINNLAGSGLMMTNGGINFDGVSPLGPFFTTQGAGGSDALTLSNASNVASTSANLGVSTGTANAYAQLRNIDGTTPRALLTAGAGDTGGLTVAAGAGDVTVQPTAGNVVLWPTGATNQVKFGNGGSFDATTSHCGSIAGSTGCLVIQDNTGAVRKVPYF